MSRLVRLQMCDIDEHLGREMEDGYQRSESVAMNAEDPDDVAMAAGMYWDT